MQYPRRVVKAGESDRTLVTAVQQQLLARGCGPIDAPGVFGPQTEASVKLFQARNVDGEGRPLKQDGELGPLTWAALFGEETRVDVEVSEECTPGVRDDAGADGPPTGSCATLTECCPRAIPEYQPYCRTTAMGGDEAMVFKCFDSATDGWTVAGGGITRLAKEDGALAAAIDEVPGERRGSQGLTVGPG